MLNPWEKMDSNHSKDSLVLIEGISGLFGVAMENI
jgi:hypothetical protein